MSQGNKVLIYIIAAAFFGFGAFGVYWAIHIANPGLLFPGAFGIVLVRKSGEKPLSIPGTVERRSELLDWLKERFPDINAQLAREVNEEVLHDERYGLTEEDRARRLSQARKLMLYSAFVLPLFFGWAMFNTQPPKVLMLILLAIPLAAVWLTWSYKGILRLYMSPRRSPG